MAGDDGLPTSAPATSARPASENPSPTTVGLDDYFGGRDHLVWLRPGTSYERPPALLVNPEVAHPRARRRYESNPPGRTPDEGVAVLHDVTISRGACIELSDGRVLAESLDQGRPDPLVGVPPEREMREAVFAAKQGSGNYGHFLVEILPRLALNRHVFPPKAPLLLRNWSRRFCLPMLEASGLGDRKVRWCGRAPVRVRTLHWPTRNTFAPLRVSPHVFELFREMAEPRRGGVTGRRLFVGRRDATTRQLENEDAALGLLRPHGFELVVPGELPFEEQIRTFAQASVVVAVSGAALTNLVFMPEGGAVVMLTPASMAGLLFWELAGHAGLELAVLWGAHTRPSASDKHEDFRVDLDLLGDVVVDVLRRVR